MADYFAKDKDVLDYIDTMSSGARPTRLELGYRIGLNMCYYEGVQWIQPAQRFGTNRFGIGRLFENSNPDSTSLRVVDNDTSMHIQKIAAGTNPNVIYVEGTPAAMNAGVEGVYRARVSEEAVNSAIDRSGYLAVAQNANYLVTICGTWGIGLSARLRTMKVGDGEEPDWDIRAFDFDPTKLILDPACIERDLSRHECVVYEDIWTAKKIKETFPDLQINENEMETFEQLDPVRMEFNRLSSGRIFSSMARHSRTKGAKVYQVHHRDASGRFPTMYVVVQSADKKRAVVNFDNPRTPFGGDGLPFQLLYGHRRSDVIWGISDADMLRSDQDSKNLLKTLWMRILQKYAHGTRYIDRRAFGTRPNDDDIRRQFTNAVGGIVLMDLGDKSRGISFPQTEAGQPPPPFVMEMLEYHADAMRRKSHKSEGNYGTVKCLHGDTEIQRVNGSRTKIRDLSRGDIVQCVDPVTMKMTADVVEWVVTSGQKPLYEVSAQRGYKIRATAEHRVLTWNGWKTVGELTVGDYLTAPRRLLSAMSPQPDRMDDAAMAAIWLAEGDKTRMDAYCVTNGLQPVIDRIKSVSASRGWVVRMDKGLRIRVLKNGQSVGPNDVLKSWGVRSMRTGTIRVPEFVMQSSDDVVAEFLRYAFACDGCASGRTVFYTSNSRMMLEDMRSLLLRFGIRSRIIKGFARSHNLNIGTQRDVALFAEYVGIIGKEQQLQQVQETLGTAVRGSREECLPSDVRRVMEHGPKWHCKNTGRMIDRTAKFPLPEVQAEDVAESEGNVSLRAALGLDVEWVKVKAIVAIDSAETYDIETQTHHNFIADGLIVHNSHVGNQQALAARDDAAEVRDDRIRQFTRTHERLIGVLWATQIRNVKSGNPSTLGALRAAGFDQDKFAALVEQDEYHPSVTLTVREETFRPRSLQQRRQDLNMAAQLQQVSPIEARKAMADLQTPVTDEDQRMADEATKAARMVLMGQPWQPRPLGMYGQFFVSKFRDATFDPRATNPQIMAMLQQAIAQQQEVDVQAQMQTDPSIRAQQQQAQMQMAMQAKQAQQQAQPEQTDVGTLLQQLSGGAPQLETAAA